MGDRKRERGRGRARESLVGGGRGGGRGGGGGGGRRRRSEGCNKKNFDTTQGFFDSLSSATCCYARGRREVAGCCG
jgi:hypothetical protein